MIDVTNRKIWVFREARSGSLAFTNWLSRVVDKPMYSVETVDQMVDDNSLLFHSHNFEMLRELKEEENPIIFRCTRRDKAEQLLSRITHNYTGISNFHQETTTEEVNKFIEITHSQKVDITVTDVLHFIQYADQDTKLWEEHSPKFTNQTLYYEDCAGNIDLPGLDLYNIHYGYGDDQWIIKLPNNYKENFYSNYKDVKALVGLYYK